MRICRPSIEIRDECPYCGFKFVVDAHDITGELHALRCIDCGEKFVVEILVSVSHKIDGIVGVSSDAVLDRIIGNAKREQHDEACNCSDCQDPPAPGMFDSVRREIAELELGDISPAEVEAVGRALDRAEAARVNEPKRSLSAAELDELRELVSIDAPGDSTELDDYDDAAPFMWCAGCHTRHFCNNAKRCTKKQPAPAHSGINTRSTPPPMSGLMKSAPTARANSGLKYGDRK